METGCNQEAGGKQSEVGTGPLECVLQVGGRDDEDGRPTPGLQQEEAATATVQPVHKQPTT